MGQIRNIRLLKEIAIVVKQLRESRNLSQEEVYNEINIHIGRIETGKANLSVSTLEMLCSYFKISMSDFFKRIENL